MPRLRLFAGLRELAGTSSVEVDASTVRGVLDAAGDRFGPAFRAGVPNARVWVNGEEAEPDQVLASDDEVALIPPVSGGATAFETHAVPVEVFAPISLTLLLIIANLFEGHAVWAAAVVGVTGAWVIDVTLTVARRGRDLPLGPVLTAVVASVAAVWSLGTLGMGLSFVVAVVLPLGWSVASDNSRVLPTLSPAVVMSLVAGGAAGSLVLTRTTIDPAQSAIGVFLAIALVATVVGALAERLSRLPFGDPFSGIALGAVVTAVVAAAIWDLDIVAFLIAGLVMAAALVAGRGLGSMLRRRAIILIERPPGFLSLLDGVVLAAALYLPVLRLVA